MAIEPANQLRPEAERECLDLHAAQPRRKIVSKLMNEHEDGKDDEKRQDPAEPNFEKMHYPWLLRGRPPANDPITAGRRRTMFSRRAGPQPAGQ